MALGLLETAVDDLTAYLQSNIAVKIAAINKRYGDIDVVPDIAEWNVGAIPIEIPALPAAIIAGKQTELQRVTINSPSLLVDNDIDIYLFYGSEKIENRFRVLSRYAIVFIELILASDGRAIGDFRTSINGPVVLSEVMAVPPFLQSIVIPIRMARSENYL